MGGMVSRESLPDQIASFEPRLESFARSLTRDPGEAQDLAQETVARALAAQARFEPGTNLAGWLFSILRNLHVSARRKSARRRTVSTEDLATELQALGGVMDPVEREVVARVELEELNAAFAGLPGIFADPLRLCAVEQLTYEEIASRLGIPIGTVMSRIYRGRRLLLKRLRG